MKNDLEPILLGPVAAIKQNQDEKIDIVIDY